MAKTRRKRGMTLTDYNRRILQLAKVHPSPTAIATILRKTPATTGKGAKRYPRATPNSVSAQLRKLRTMGLLKAQVGRGRLRSSHERRYHRSKLPMRILQHRAFTLTEMLVGLKKVS